MVWLWESLWLQKSPAGWKVVGDDQKWRKAWSGMGHDWEMCTLKAMADHEGLPVHILEEKQIAELLA